MSKPFHKSAVSIQKNAYAMASLDGVTAELTLYGDIYETQPTDWWTGEPIKGQFIMLDEFLEDLKQIEGCKKITIRMNSYGGDAGVSATIHNRLRELAKNGAKLTCIVDGVAMSGGSIIMCAADTVKAYPSSLIMIHKCWSFLFGGYNADEMREMAATNDAWDKMQSEVYQRKTGLSNAVVLHMMGDTTYMTGREAKEKGFVDELLDDAEATPIAASADGRSLFVHGRQMHLAPGMFAPDMIPTVQPAEGNEQTPEAVETHTQKTEEGGNEMTIEELRTKYPEIAAQIEAEARAACQSENQEAVNTAVQNERARIQQIDEIAPLFSNELVHEAKYGETACTAQEMSYRAARNAQAQGQHFMTALQDDAADSGVDDVPAAPGKIEEGEKSMTPQERMAQGEADAQALKNK